MWGKEWFIYSSDKGEIRDAVHSKFNWKTLFVLCLFVTLLYGNAEGPKIDRYDSTKQTVQKIFSESFSIVL